MYEGRCIYFGPASEARQYFIDIGFECPPRQTTADFLTAITDHHERKPRADFAGRVPRTPKEFEDAYKASSFFATEERQRIEYQGSVQETNPAQDFREAAKQQKQKHVSVKDPYTINFVGQVKALTVRQFQLTRGDMTSVVSRYASNVSFSSRRLCTDHIEGSHINSKMLILIGDQSYCRRKRFLPFAPVCQRCLHPWRRFVLLFALQRPDLSSRIADGHARSSYPLQAQKLCHVSSFGFRYLADLRRYSLGHCSDSALLRRALLYVWFTEDVCEMVTLLFDIIPLCSLHDGILQNGKYRRSLVVSFEMQRSCLIAGL